MKVTLLDIKSAEQALNSIMTTPMPVKLTYRLSRITAKLVEELDRIEKQRLILVKQFGTLDEKNQSYTVQPEKSEEFFKQWADFLKEEIEMDIEPIPFELFSNSDIKISPVGLMTLKKFIAEPIVETQAPANSVRVPTSK